MPQIDEIRKAKEIGHIGHNTFIWAGCQDCGKERWVPLYKGQSKYQLCHSCARPRGHFGEKNPSWKGGDYNT